MHGALPSKEFISPEPVAEAVSADSAQSDGLWKLTLDKEPPPGVNFVLLLPVCPTKTSDGTLPSRGHQTLSAMQVQPQVSLSPVQSNGQLGVSPALTAPRGHLNSVIGFKQDPECEQPLDLSKKMSAVSEVSPLAVKSEPEEFEIPATEEDTGRKATLGTNSEVKMDHRDLNL